MKRSEENTRRLHRSRTHVLKQNYINSGCILRTTADKTWIFFYRWPGIWNLAMAVTIKESSYTLYLSDPVYDDVGLAGFKSRANTFLLAWYALSFLTPTILSFSSFHGLVVVVWGWGIWTDRVFSLSPGLVQPTPNDNNNNNNNNNNSWISEA